MTEINDTERRRKLNAELMKQRVEANFINDSQWTREATQTLNPITGRVKGPYEMKPYEDKFTTATDVERMERILKQNFYPIKPIEKVYIIDYSDLLEAKETSTEETSTEYLDFQKALARKEVRECRMSESQYAAFLDTLDELVAAYNESPDLTLRTIRDAEGLDLALRQIERRKELSKLMYVESYHIEPKKYPPLEEYVTSGEKLSEEHIIN